MISAIARRLACLGVAVLMLPGPASAAPAAPLRVLPPGRSIRMPTVALCAAEYLAERLAECRGVDIVQGERISRVHAWLASGAFELTDEARWQRLASYVAIDAMISVVPLPAEEAGSLSVAALEVRIFRAGGVTPLKATIGGAGGPEMPEAVAALAERVGRELHLDDADVKRLSDARIVDPAGFRLYYSTRTGGGGAPGNPYNSAVVALENLHAEKPSWAMDAATVRTAASYIHWALRGRDSDKSLVARRMARAPLLRLMGTAHEEEAYPLLRLDRRAATEPMLADLETALLEIAQPVGRGRMLAGASASGDLDDLLDAKPAEKDALGGMAELPDRPTAGGSDYTPDQRLGALRMLGVMASPKAIPLLRQTATLADPALRQATAEALAAFPGDVGVAELTRLAGDADARVAFTAARALMRRQRPPADFRARARAMLQDGEPFRTWAAEALAADATLDDAALAARLAGDEAPSVRATLRRARVARGAGTPGHLAAAMTHEDSDAVVAAIRRLPRESLAADSDACQRLVRLANDPDDAVAGAAREALAPLRPKDAQGRVRFDLAAAQPYMRHRAVALLKGSSEAWARAELIAACTNIDAHTRVEALKALAALDPAAARGLLLGAMDDPHLFVRFHSAALLAAVADAAQERAIRDVMPRQKDRATVLYLADALARATGAPPPAPQPPANCMTGSATIAWLHGPVGHNPDSPYRMHFKPSHGNHVRDDVIPDILKEAHARGRAYLYNVGPMGEAGVAAVDASAQDSAWIYLDDQLDTPALPYIDGVDFGNGAMSPDALWPAGWRLFCDDTGIDAARVAGEKKNLNAYESDAWRAWALRRCVEGRNRVYDYFKLKFGKLHPGIAVCTAIGGGFDAVAPDWKFDAIIMHSSGRADSRTEAYALVRRAKTLWPDRPVFWLGEGLGVANMTTMKYDFAMPTEPLAGRHYPAYTDALTAWMAGADPGWTCSWVLRAHGWKGDPDYTGAAVSPEDCQGDRSRLRAAIDFAFAGVEPVIREKEARAKAAAEPGRTLSDEDAQPDALLDSVVKADDSSTLTNRIARDKERMYLGFHVYAKHLLDVARLFASLPRGNPKPDALVIESRPAGGGFGSPGADLLNSYDFLLDVNAAVRLELNRYRMIAVTDPAALTDPTIAGITRWLKETPGLLYVHRDLTGDNARQSGTPERFDGRLTLDWPWEGDLSPAAVAPPTAGLELASPAGATLLAPGSIVARTFNVTGQRARVLLTSGGAPVLVVWQHPDFKGAVVFDGIAGDGPPYRQELRRVLAELRAKSGVGIELDGPIRHEADESDRWTADATAGSTDVRTIHGVDLLTGALDPRVGPNKSAAFVAKAFQGKYAAAYNGISVLCDRPIAKVEKIDGGLRIECDGLLQAASDTGKLDVSPVSGAALPPVAGERVKPWILIGSDEGVATTPALDGSRSRTGTVTYVRCARPVTMRSR